MPIPFALEKKALAMRRAFVVYSLTPRYESRDSRLQGFKASRLQGFKASRLQGFKAVGFDRRANRDWIGPVQTSRHAQPSRPAQCRPQTGAGYPGAFHRTPDRPAPVVIDGGRRANCFNDNKKVIGTDPEAAKAANVESTQHTMQGLTTVDITVTGVNDAGEEPPRATVSVVMT